MDFKAHVKTSFLDFPGKIATVFFTGKCNYMCAYCHNKEMIKSDENKISHEQALEYITLNKKYLDGVVITGGECTLENELEMFLRAVKEMGLTTKIDTNGSNPRVVQNLIHNRLVDYIALDFKASPIKYDGVTKQTKSFEKVSETLEILKNSDILYEIRTTVCKELHEISDFQQIKNEIGVVGRYVIQNYKNQASLPIESILTSYTRHELDEITKGFDNYFSEFLIRY